MNHQQYQQLIAYLQAQMAKSSVQESDQMDNNNTIGMSYSFHESSPNFDQSNLIIDSGATSHICHSLHFFDSYISLSNRSVLLPNSSKVPVKAIGNVTLKPDFVLRNVLFIPDFHLNIISVSSLLKHNAYSLSFTDNVFLIQDILNQKVIGTGKVT